MSISLREQLLQKRPKNDRFYTIAIDGRGGAGKTKLAEYLSKILPGFLFINGDDYFEPTPDEIAWGDFNDERFMTDVINPLQKIQRKLAYRPYDWHKDPHISEQIITIKEGICIERSFIFSFDLDWDLKIWVETPAYTALQRGLKRDKLPRERPIKGWEQVWQPRENAHIKEFDPFNTADLVIDGTKPFEDQLK